jgi:L-iditol 2-dehydrogenase
MSRVTGKAMVATGIGVPWELREYPVPDPEPGAVVTKITLSSICGSDVHSYKGEYRRRTDVAGSRETPRILGHEFVGRVYKLGPGVTTDFSGQPLKEGDRVVWCYFVPCGRCQACVNQAGGCPNRLRFGGSSEEWPHFKGAFAEYYYVRPGQWIFKVPERLADEAVVYVDCAACTVAYGLQKIQLPMGARVVIQGAGGLGLCASAIARDMGAAQVTIIDRLPHRLKLAKSFGADQTIDSNELPTAEARIDRIKQLTGGRGVDLVVEVCSDPAAVPEGVEMLTPGGTYLTMGLVTGDLLSPLDMEKFVHRGLRLVGSGNYVAGTMLRVLDFMDRTRDRYAFDKLISHKFGLEDIGRAFAEVIAGNVARAGIVAN